MKPFFTCLLLLGSLLMYGQSAITWDAAASDVAVPHFSNQHPRITIDASGNPLVVWGKTSANNVQFSRGTSNGFTTPVVLNPANIPAFTASWAGPDIASHGDTVYVVFKHTPEDTNHIYVVHSYDGGVNFSPAVRVDYIADSISRFPTLSTDAQGNPLVAYMKFDPGFDKSRYVVVRSNDFGNSFMPDVKASGHSGGTVCDCCPACLVSSGNTTAMVYRDNLSNLRDTWIGVSTDGGVTFPDGGAIDNTGWIVNSCPASGPDAVIVGDSIYAVYMSAASGTTKCYFSKASLTTMESTPSKALSSIGNYPRIANSGTAAAIVWPQPAGNATRLALLFSKNISTGFPPAYEAVAPDHVANADVALFNGKIYVVWEDDNSGTVKFRKGTYTPTTAVGAVTAPDPVRLYPNPASETFLTVDLKQQTETAVPYSITNMLGQILSTGTANSVQGALHINVSGLHAGSYTLEMTTGTGLVSIQFIKS